MTIRAQGYAVRQPWATAVHQSVLSAGAGMVYPGVQGGRRGRVYRVYRGGVYLYAERASGLGERYLCPESLRLRRRKEALRRGPPA